MVIKENLSHEKIFSYLQRCNRIYLSFTHDILVASCVIPLSLLLRVGGDIINYSLFFVLRHMTVYALLAAGVIIWLELYRGLWRHTSLNDLIAIALGVTYITLLYLPLVLFMSQSEVMPLSLIAINWFLTISLLGGSRIAYRTFADLRNALIIIDQQKNSATEVILVGATNQAELFIRELKDSQNPCYKVIGLVDEHSVCLGRNVHGVEVMGKFAGLPTIIKKLRLQKKDPQLLIIADPTLDSTKVRSLIQLNAGLNIKFARLPALSDISHSTGTSLKVRSISIEDLLGRPQDALDHTSISKLIQGKKVIITGAGGTIGGELTRQIANFSPGHLTLLDHSEYLLYTIDLEISEKYPNLSHSMVIGDVADHNRIEDIMTFEKPEIVFHAAALKHITISESNPNEAVLTNIIGTRNIAESCRANQVEAMVLISTDKAINPTNVMEASKRLAESYCQSLNMHGNKKSNGTKYITVRFGNVIGSTGSVVPLFQHQISRGGPITITDPGMSRYFITVRAAVELVLQSTALGHVTSLSKGQIFVLNMGESIKIVDLAHKMIQMAGLQPDHDIKIKYTGQRPGEKLHEELFNKHEKLLSTNHKGVMLASPIVYDYQMLYDAFKEIEKTSRQRLTKDTLVLLKALVPEYNPVTVCQHDKTIH